MRAGASERQSGSWTLNPWCRAAAVTTGETANTAEQTGVPGTKRSSLRQTTPSVPGGGVGDGKGFTRFPIFWEMKSSEVIWGSRSKFATSSFWHQGLPSSPWTETLLPPDASEWSTRICVECEESHKEAGPERWEKGIEERKSMRGSCGENNTDWDLETQPPTSVTE